MSNHKLEVWISSTTAAELLKCTPAIIRDMAREGIIRGNKKKGEWQICSSDVRFLASMIKEDQPLIPGSNEDKRQSECSDQNVSSETHELSKSIDPGMIEVSIALSGVSAAIAAILPTIGSTTLLKVIVAIFAELLAFLSAYSALWLLAWFCVPERSLLGYKEISQFLLQPEKSQPYWLLGYALFFWLLLSILIGIIAIQG